MGGTHEQQRQCPPWRRPPWRSTMMAQALLFVALYGALSIGKTQMPGNGDEEGGYLSMAGRHRDLYFISVVGGSRPRDQQMQLLRQMENVARTFKVEFIVNLSELGKKDPLMQNVSFYFPHLRVPWYGTSASLEPGGAYFLRKIKFARGHTLDLIGLDTGLWQASLRSEEQTKQLRWLTKTLAATNSTWRVVVGFHPLAADCEGARATEKTSLHQRLRQILLKNRVSVDLSSQGCGCRSCGPNCSELDYRATGDGFHLHAVSPLTIESYFVGSNGDITSSCTVRQEGREDT